MNSPPRPQWLLISLIVFVGLLSYSSSFSGQFVHDDRPHILTNAALHDLGDLKSILSWSRRPLVNLTLAINYWFGLNEKTGEVSPLGFHVFNLAIHLLAALTLFGVIRRSICLSGQNVLYNHAHWIAFSAAILWVAHPLNTQAVTYIIQRAESMMGLFYLLTLYCFIRSVDSPRVILWRTLAIIAAGLGMFSKAVIVSVPLTIFLYDRCFIAGSFKTTLQKRWAFYLPLCATWLLLLPTGIAQGVLNPNVDGPATVGFSFKGITPLNYLLTQGGVILHYLHLALWPGALCFDYKWPVAKTVGSILPGLLIISLLGFTALWLLRKRPRLGFICIWFFLILGPTSSFIPIEDIAAEHRMYLALASITLLVSLGFWFLYMRLAGPSPLFIAVPLIATTALGITTFKRNRIYQDPLTLWRDVIVKKPNNPRGYLQVGTHLGARAVALIQSGKQEEGIAILDQAAAQYMLAVEKDPLYAEARFNYANILGMQGKMESAITQFLQLISDHPQYVEGYVGLATAYLQTERADAAIEVLNRALEIKPNHQRANDLLKFARQQKPSSPQ